LQDDSALSSLINLFTDLNLLTYFQWDVSTLPGLVIMVLLILLSGLVSGSEVAFFSLSPSQLATFDPKNKRSRGIGQFLDEPEKLLGTILVGNNLFNVAFIIVSYFVINKLFDFHDNMLIETLFNIVIITSVLVMFGEILPKTYAAKHNVKMAHKTVSLLKVLYVINSPLVNLLNASSEIVHKRLSRKESYMTDADIDQAIELTVGTESTEANKQILKGIVKFGNTSVKQIMQPRLDVVAIDQTLDFHALINIVRDCGYSRIPVYEGDFDNITGLLYAKDLLAYLDRGPDFRWQKLQRKAFYVPESKKIDDLLEEFRHRRVHMAVVVDEYGGASGIVTLEDVLEEVIGEIKDEFDDAQEIQYKKMDDKSYLFHGKTQLYDVCRVVGIPTDTFDKVRGDADTLAGLILEMTGALPKSGDVIEFDKYSFKIITVNNIRIVRVQLTIRDDIEAAA
jgi:gliding motility-associated protein GldE